MAHLIWRDGATVRKAALPAGVTSIDHMATPPIAPETQHVVIADEHPAAGIPVSRLMIDFDSGTVDVLAPPPPSFTAADVRAEASRRMQAAFGARDADHLDIIVSNATREVARLNQIKVGVPHPAGGWMVAPRDWTPAERLRLAQLHGADTLLEAIRAASNVLEAADPVPADYAADSRWPG